MSKYFIFSMKDRLLDYFMPPFIAPGEREAMSALATLINDGDSKHAATLSPKDFDLYQLGQITDEGQCFSDFRIVCSAGSLVRGRIRDGAAPGNGAVPQPVAQRAAPTVHGAELVTPDGSGFGES